ncbi:DUF4430 domain-containing protein [Candidatus Roizmanbacteria bacterium]|nr:DUF4430 domain-containing protein [Candidatus Roizmanbacteria bacterium]
MFSKFKKPIVLIVLAFILVAAGVFTYKTFFAKKATVSEQITVFLKTDTGDQYLELRTKKGNTALQLTQERMDVDVRGEGKNAYVTGINGREADSKKKEYWAFYVNGKPAEVGAGSYILKQGDKIEWKIENY